MITVIADTHRTSGHGLRDRTLAAVRAADAVVHAGDFTTAAVVDAIRTEAGQLHAVYGNNDAAAVRERLPARSVFAVDGLRIALVHGHEHDETGLALLGRQEGADVVVSGHSHRPGVVEARGVTLLNPGSYAQPRWNRPAHAELEGVDGGFEGRLLEPDGTVFETFEVRPGR